MPKRSTKISVPCPCGTDFEVTQARLDAGRGRFCSKTCRHQYGKRRSGLTYKIVAENPAWFRPGHVPWSLGVKRGSPWNKGLTGVHFSPETEFKPGQNAGPENSKWLGDEVGYGALHSWLVRMRGRAVTCEWCGQTEGRIEWANLSHEYRRDLDDWVSLCKKCHVRHDSGSARGAMARRFG